MALELIKLVKGSSAVTQVGSFGFFKLSAEPSIDFNPVFSQNTPQQIKSVSEYIGANNLTSSNVEAKFGWKIGDAIDITLTTGEVIQVRIIGINHDTLSDGSGKAGITLDMANCLATRYPMNSSKTNAGGYALSKMKTNTLPTLKSLLPQEWQNIIVKVDKKSSNGGGSNFTEVVTTSDDLFLLCTKEVFGSGEDAKGGENEGDWYEYYETNNTLDSRIKSYDSTGDGVANTDTNWFLRSCKGSSTTFASVNYGGGSSTSTANTSMGISFAFCV